ncbi:hypothetical protein JZO81_17570 [Enterococcus hulanensis]|uniref:hypothetical protein n=1 Tax=Enterococcus TaxID=1350 RepID=UPI000B5AA3BE|nr:MULTISPECIES: hypothetical protein [Enterococcus]MBO0412867.1 hypothetical protein [Enterococcus hulanensis]OTO19988.1 hypothetical protein A5875_001337 [Enterococcus sp. 3H8_DIV0648]
MKNQLQIFFRKLRIKIQEKGTSRKSTLIILAVVLVTLSTFAWFTTSDSMQNKFKSGNPLFDVALVDDFTSPNELTPETEISKVVAAKNTETIDAFVRMMVFPAALKDGEPFEVQLEDHVQLIGLDTSKWKDGKDGYFYYLDKLAPGETSSNLFEKVKLIIPNDQKDNYKDVTFDIVAKTEAIHTKKYDYRISWWGTDDPQTAEPLKTIDETLAEKRAE